MKKKSKTTNQLKVRKLRFFSEEFKKAKVDDLVNKRISAREICELYGISRQSVYNWLYRYSPHHERSTKQVVEMESEAKRTKLLLHRVAELEGAIGRKQLKIDYLEKLIEIASKEIGYDLKKTFEPSSSSGSGPIDSSTLTP